MKLTGTCDSGSSETIHGWTRFLAVRKGAAQGIAKETTVIVYVFNRIDFPTNSANCGCGNLAMHYPLVKGHDNPAIRAPNGPSNPFLRRRGETRASKPRKWLVFSLDSSRFTAHTRGTLETTSHPTPQCRRQLTQPFSRGAHETEERARLYCFYMLCSLFHRCPRQLYPPARFLL